MPAAPGRWRVLARLRDVQGNPLLMRTRKGYVLTPRAQAIQPQLASALGHLREVFRQPVFDPASARRTVRLAAADTHRVLILPGVATRLAAWSVMILIMLCLTKKRAAL